MRDSSPGEYSLLHAVEWKEKEAASFQGDAEQVSKLGSLTKPPEETHFPLALAMGFGGSFTPEKLPNKICPTIIFTTT